MKGSESVCGEGNRAATLRVAESHGRTGACVHGEVCAGCGRGTCGERHSVKCFGDINSRRDTKLTQLCWGNVNLVGIKDTVYVQGSRCWGEQEAREYPANVIHYGTGCTSSIIHAEFKYSQVHLVWYSTLLKKHISFHRAEWKDITQDDSEQEKGRRNHN